jgi:hypothetical protein
MYGVKTVGQPLSRLFIFGSGRATGADLQPQSGEFLRFVRQRFPYGLDHSGVRVTEHGSNHVTRNSRKLAAQARQGHIELTRGGQAGFVGSSHQSSVGL